MLEIVFSYVSFEINFSAMQLIVLEIQNTVISVSSNQATGQSSLGLTSHALYRCCWVHKAVSNRSRSVPVPIVD